MRLLFNPPLVLGTISKSKLSVMQRSPFLRLPVSPTRYVVQRYLQRVVRQPQIHPYTFLQPRKYCRYFLLPAYPDLLESSRYIHKYDYPAIFRIDRIDAYELMEERFTLPYANRFQEGEFRKRVQFMYAGSLERIRFRYTGKSVDAILDRLPTAKILSQDERSFVIEAEVFGKGIVMWLLSQGERVEVLGPEHIRTEMHDTISHMLELYR